MFLLYVNDIDTDICSSIHLVADDYVLYKIIEHLKIINTCNMTWTLLQWTMQWQMKLKPLNFVRTLYLCDAKVKATSVWPTLEYATIVWIPYYRWHIQFIYYCIWIVWHNVVVMGIIIEHNQLLFWALLKSIIGWGLVAS